MIFAAPRRSKADLMTKDLHGPARKPDATDPLGWLVERCVLHSEGKAGATFSRVALPDAATA
jgi:hypothetical protein